MHPLQIVGQTPPPKMLRFWGTAKHPFQHFHPIFAGAWLEHCLPVLHAKFFSSLGKDVDAIQLNTSHHTP